MSIGLLNIIIYFFVMVPIALKAEGWSDIYFIGILPFLILGIFENIIGLYLIITENINKLITGYIGLLYFIIGFVSIVPFSYYALTFISTGTILIFLGVKDEFY